MCKDVVGKVANIGDIILATKGLNLSKFKVINIYYTYIKAVSIKKDKLIYTFDEGKFKII